MREKERGAGRGGQSQRVREKEGGNVEMSVWRGVGNILQAALMAILKMLLLRNVRNVVYYE